jgi:hypothetical protein
MSLFDLIADMVGTGLVPKQFYGRGACAMKIGWTDSLMEEEALTGRNTMPTDS